MKNFKRIVALGLAATMVMGSSITAFAEGETTQDVGSKETGKVDGTEQTSTGTGTANYLNKKVFKVTIPTQAVMDQVFDFYSDPQGLIAETNAAQLGTGVEIWEDTGIFFKTTSYDANVVGAMGTSDPLTITNKSSSGVTVAIKAKLVEAGSDKYAAGYSTTEDFSKSGEDAKGLYLALQADAEKPTALSATEATVTNVALSAADQFATTYDTSSSQYKYEPVENAVFPTYNMTVRGVLNRNLPSTTWYKATDGQPLTVGAALAMPSIEVKFTPSYIDADQVVAFADAEGIYIGKTEEEGFLGDKSVTDLKVSGETVTVSSLKTDKESGWIIIPISNVYTPLGLTTEDEKGAVLDYVTTVEFKIGTATYFANVIK